MKRELSELQKTESSVASTTITKVLLDIRTKTGLSSFQLDYDFTGRVTLDFNQGGLAGAKKEEMMK